jgi:Calcineurin-like phosphoesterase
VDDRGDEPREREPRRRLRAAAPALLACVIGLVGAWLGLALLARETVPIGPFRVELDVGFGRGETVLGLPPFGALTADTHLSPLHVSATLQDVGVQRLTDVVNDEGLDGLVSDVERDARESVRTIAWLTLLAGTIGGTALAALVYRTDWHRVATGGVAALLGVALCEVLLLTTFQPAAFTEPTYSGSLALAPQLIGPVSEATGRIEDLRAGLEQVVDGTVRAYTSLQASPPADDAIRVLHMSDIHASPLGMDFAQEVAEGFDVDFVIDTGDITSFGTPVENLIATEIPGFGVPYVFVRGSHDSIALQEAIAREPNAIVLDGREKTVDGLTVYGLGHPAFTPARGAPVDAEDFAALARSAGPVIAADLEAAPEPVDVVAVHDDRMAEAIAGRVPLGALPRNHGDGEQRHALPAHRDHRRFGGRHLQGPRGHPVLGRGPVFLPGAGSAADRLRRDRAAPRVGQSHRPTRHGRGGVRGPGAHAHADPHADASECVTVRRVTLGLALIRGRPERKERRRRSWTGCRNPGAPCRTNGGLGAAGQTGELRGVLRDGARAPVPGPVPDDRQRAGGGGADAGRVRGRVGAVGPGERDGRADRLPVPNRDESLPQPVAASLTSRATHRRVGPGRRRLRGPSRVCPSASARRSS